jgi:hypothetical protein
MRQRGGGSSRIGSLAPPRCRRRVHQMHHVDQRRQARRSPYARSCHRCVATIHKGQIASDHAHAWSQGAVSRHEETRRERITPAQATFAPITARGRIRHIETQRATICRSTTTRTSHDTQTVRPYGQNQVSRLNQLIDCHQTRRLAELAFTLSGRRDLNPRPLDPQDVGSTVRARHRRYAGSKVGRFLARCSRSRRSCGPRLVPKRW